MSSDQLPSDLAGAHVMIVALRSEALIRRLETEKLKFLIAKLRREQFGQSSERGRLLVEQLELAIADVEESQGEAEAEADIVAPAAAAAAREHRTRRSPRPVLPADLPVERIVYPAPCACAKCGGARLRKLDEIVSRSLECEPRRWKIIEHVREKMTCRDCDGITETPAPSHPIPRGFAGPNLLASVLVSKFMLHQPLNRQSDTFAREGIAIDTSTLADRVGACAVALAPLVEAIRRHVLAAERLHTDDTTVPVLAKGKTATGRLWTYVRDDRPFGGADPPAAAFHYSRSRSGEYPREHLAAYGGIMQADAFAGYNDLYDARRKPAPIVEAACWSHGRRKLFDIAKLDKAPIALEAVRRIDEIFALERTIRGRSAAERLAVRQDQVKPLVLELEAFLREKRALLSPGSTTAKAISYSLTRWGAFTRFLDDGRICLSNNAAERALRGIAIGRRNWTFCGSDAGGNRAAAIYTLIETAKLNDVDPQAWLADVLVRLPDHPTKRIDELLPWAWKASREAATLAQAA
jgi:transposase